jgi:hypothetical protein
MGAALQLIPHQWKPGQSGNPAGRPKGSRCKLEEIFLADLLASWQEKGKDAISRAIEDDPVAYVKTVASLMPKQVDPEGGLNGISRDELRTAIDALRGFLAASDAGESGTRAGQSGQAE